MAVTLETRQPLASRSHSPTRARASPGLAGLRRLTTFPRSFEQEMLDRDGYAAGELRTNFRDIERVNRWLGGSTLTLRAFQDLLLARPGIAGGDAVSAI